MKKNIISIIIVLAAFFAKAQESVMIGEWRGHFPYNSMISVTSDEKEKIYAASKFSLFSYDNTTGLIDIMSKINYLSDIGISCIEYNKPNSTLVIAYSNSNVDLLSKGKIINMNDIYRSNIIGNKTINNIFTKDKLAYLSCGFGIVVIDLVKHEIAETYYIGENGKYVNVTDFTYMPDIKSFIASTDHGLYIAAEDSNLSNYNNWHKITNMPNATSNFCDIEYFNTKLFAAVKSEVFNYDTLLVFNGNEWSYFNNIESTDEIEDIYANEAIIVITNSYGINTYDKNFELINKYWQYSSGASLHSNAAIMVGDTCWIADNRNGLVKCIDPWKSQIIMPTGPEVSQAFTLKKQGDKVFATPGGFNVSWVPLYNSARYSYFCDNDWTTITSKDIPELGNLSDVTDIAVDPRNPNRLFIATYFYGLLEIVDGKLVNIYNGSNSPLKAPNGYTDEYVRCGGLAFDNNNNLWVSHSLGAGIANVLMANNEWGNGINGGLFTNNFNGKEVSTIVIDKHNQKWLKTREYASIYVVNDNNTPNDPSDDKGKCLTNSTGNGALNGQISAIAVDNDGEIWIGSDLGLKVIYYPNRIFEGGNFDAQEILIDYEGTVRPLLESESVTAIAVDFGNNKWIGTASSGVYYISADGSKQYEHFTKENSCLLSNDISAICIDEMGEVFISTSNGICSYKGESSEPQDTNEEIYAYPNPVRPDYTGQVAVTGLVDNSIVKIADFSGRIVFSQRSNGGMITWDGNLPNGKRASSGIYVVFATDSEGRERAVTKILFIE